MLLCMRYKNLHDNGVLLFNEITLVSKSYTQTLKELLPPSPLLLVLDRNSIHSLEKPPTLSIKSFYTEIH